MNKVGKRRRARKSAVLRNQSRRWRRRDFPWQLLLFRCPLGIKHHDDPHEEELAPEKRSLEGDRPKVKKETNQNEGLYDLHACPLMRPVPDPGWRRAVPHRLIYPPLYSSMVCVGV